jgi:hypothetical protein
MFIRRAGASVTIAKQSMAPFCPLTLLSHSFGKKPEGGTRAVVFNPLISHLFAGEQRGNKKRREGEFGGTDGIGRIELGFEKAQPKGSAPFLCAPASAHSCACKSRRKLTTASE